MHQLQEDTTAHKKEIHRGFLPCYCRTRQKIKELKKSKTNAREDKENPSFLKKKKKIDSTRRIPWTIKIARQLKLKQIKTPPNS